TVVAAVPLDSDGEAPQRCACGLGALNLIPFLLGARVHGERLASPPCCSALARTISLRRYRHDPTALGEIRHRQECRSTEQELALERPARPERVSGQVPHEVLPSEPQARSPAPLVSVSWIPGLFLEASPAGRRWVELCRRRDPPRRARMG